MESSDGAEKDGGGKGWWKDGKLVVVVVLVIFCCFCTFFLVEGEHEPKGVVGRYDMRQLAKCSNN